MAPASTAPMATTFVDNTAESTLGASDIFSDGASAQSFTTGMNDGGYVLSSIEIVSTAQDRAFSVEIHTTDADGAPDTLFVTLTAPSDFTVADVEFTAPPNTMLAANTTYAVFLPDPLGSDAFLSATLSDTDEGSDGWGIGDAYHFYNIGTSAWQLSSSGRSLRMAVKGTAVATSVTAPNPPTVLEAAPYGDDAVLLTWTAPASGTTPTGYKVEVSADGMTNWTDAEDDTESTDTTWIHGGLAASATRHYRVSALASGTASTPSATDSATTCAAGVPWCPTLTAGTDTIATLTYTGFSSTFGSLSPASFRHGGSTYTSTALFHTDIAGSSTSLSLRFDSALPAALDGFVLRSGSQELSLASATYSGGSFTYDWSTPPFGPWTDGQVVAFELAAASNANNLATGAPTISGAARVGETLTAARGNIADVDGRPDTFPDDYTFQWVRVNADDTSPVNIGTDASTYALVAADEGKKIKVEVSFQDDDGNDEEVTSAAYPSGTETVGAACDVLWCATLTVGTTTGSGGNTIYGFRQLVPPVFGSLSPNSFDRGTATVGVVLIQYNSGTGGKLDFQVTRSAGTTPPDGLLGSAGLVLTLGSETFTFTPGSSSAYEFDPGALSWNAGDTVEVSLALAPTGPLPKITIEADRPKAAARTDYIHYTLTRAGPASAALTVPVTLAGPDGNDWALKDTDLGYEVTFAEGASTARLTIRLAAGLNSVAFSSSATTGGTLVASLGDVDGHDTTDTAAVEVVVAPFPHWIARLTQAAHRFGEGGGAQDVEIEVYATSADLPAPSSEADGDAWMVVVFSTDGRTAVGHSTPGMGDYTIRSDNLDVPTSTFSAGADGLQRGRATATFTPAQDSVVEGDETLVFILERRPSVPLDSMHFAGPDGTIASASATYPVTLVDDDFGVLDVAVTSTPGASADTYGAGDEIRFTVTFSQPATVTGSPHFEFSLGASGSEVTTDAAYARGSGTTDLVFAYTVQSGDMDTDGISVGDGATTVMFDTGEHIRNAGGTDATLTHGAPGTQSGHKVDGSMSPSGAPTAPVGLQAEAVGANRIVLTWNLPSSIGGSAIAGYRIERSDDGEDPCVSGCVRPRVFGEQRRARSGDRRCR